jgi:hypothetical protein
MLLGMRDMGPRRRDEPRRDDVDAIDRRRALEATRAARRVRPVVKRLGPLAAALIALASCRGDAPAAARDAGAPVARDLPVAPEPGDPRGAAYDAIYARLSACNLAHGFVARGCAAQEELGRAFGRAADGRNPDALAELAAFRAAARQHMTDPHPVIRYVAIEWVYQVGGERWREVADAVAREPDREVLLALAQVLDPRRDGALAAQVLRLAEHHDAAIRARALRGLGAAPGVPGAFEALGDHARADPDADAQADACRALGSLDDARAVAVFEELLVPTAPPRRYEACFRGLVAMWAEHGATDERAYRLTLRLLARADHPVDRYFAPLVTLGALPRVLDDDARRGVRRPFVDVGALEQALRTLAASRRAPAGLRDAAGDALADLRAKRPRPSPRSDGSP